MMYIYVQKLHTNIEREGQRNIVYRLCRQFAGGCHPCQLLSRSYPPVVPRTWCFRLGEPSQNARDIQVQNLYSFSKNHQSLHDFFSTQMSTDECNFPSVPTVPTLSQLLSLIFRKLPSSGVVLHQYHCAWMSPQVFAFDMSGGHGVELREVMAISCCSSMQTQEGVQHIGISPIFCTVGSKIGS